MIRTARLILVPVLCGWVLYACTSFVSFPETVITNGIIRARLYLPDTASGYYRSTRFDWSGVTPALTCMGHSYFGQWFQRYDPRINDAIMGPVEDFDPLGYGEQGPGGTFVKIGVGVLSKPDDRPYSPFRYYEIRDPGRWKIRRKAAEVRFSHILTGEKYAYSYTKTVRLIKGKAEMVLVHSLKNTGNHTIETDVYDHNLLVIDRQPTGPGFTVSFQFPLKGGGQGIGDLAKIEGNRLVFVKPLRQHDHVYLRDLRGFTGDLKDYDFRVENSHTGAGVRIRGSRPLDKLVFWASATTLCPEPYIHLKVRPGELIKWTIQYDFYTFPISK